MFRIKIIDTSIRCRPLYICLKNGVEGCTEDWSEATLFTSTEEAETAMIEFSQYVPKFTQMHVCDRAGAPYRCWTNDRLAKCHCVSCSTGYTQYANENDRVYKEWRSTMPDAETTRKIVEGEK